MSWNGAYGSPFGLDSKLDDRFPRVSYALSTDGGIIFEVTTETGEFPVFEVEWIPGTSNEVDQELPQRLELSRTIEIILIRQRSFNLVCHRQGK